MYLRFNNFQYSHKTFTHNNTYIYFSVYVYNSDVFKQQIKVFFFFFCYTIARLVFSIRVTQEGFSKVGKQHGCPLGYVCSSLTIFVFISLSVQNVCEYMAFLGVYMCMHAYVCVAYIYKSLLKSCQRSLTTFNKWISHQLIGLTIRQRLWSTRRT